MRLRLPSSFSLYSSRSFLFPSCQIHVKMSLITVRLVTPDWVLTKDCNWIWLSIKVLETTSKKGQRRIC
ncbi:hypothetical protein TNIN_353381 [Trichonephila inaurata madagascariensis]|uniref:Uncharacterized protein n=1 Tax=Trichonephila inaurata madagascariensis TaxID=2747483 RepID=A0A8X6YI26_9ARAC|nr:hypothetical protein TNIN_353381 [Trichonephila inaurata madagascariensis]